jgi:hypothetical protein
VFTWKGPDTNHSATGDSFDTDPGKSPGQVVHVIGERRYGGDVPAYCVGAIPKYSKRYFFANKA